MFISKSYLKIYFTITIYILKHNIAHLKYNLIDIIKLYFKCEIICFKIYFLIVKFILKHKIYFLDIKIIL